MKSFAIFSAFLFSTITFTSSVPVVTLIVGMEIVANLDNVSEGGCDIVTQAMLFFVLIIESLNMFCRLFSFSVERPNGNLLMLLITASSEAFIPYDCIRYFASALVFISLRIRSFLIAGSVSSACQTFWFMLSISP